MTTHESPRLAAVIDQLTQRTRERDCARAVTAHYLGLVREAEARALLPVIRTCGDCGWRTVQAPSGLRYCGHPCADRDLVAPLDAPPPPSCPLRGAQ